MVYHIINQHKFGSEIAFYQNTSNFPKYKHWIQYFSQPFLWVTKKTCTLVPPKLEIRISFCNVSPGFPENQSKTIFLFQFKWEKYPDFVKKTWAILQLLNSLIFSFIHYLKLCMQKQCLLKRKQTFNCAKNFWVSYKNLFCFYFLIVITSP